MFRVFKDGAQFSKKFQMKIWDGYISFYRKENFTLPFGLWKELLVKCDENKIQYVFKNFDLKKELDRDINYDLVKMFCDEIDKQTDENLVCRDYQIKGVYKALKYKRGIIEYATASGKSYLQYIIIRFLIVSEKADKILLIVPTVGLVSQMYADFKTYGLKNIDDKVVCLTKDTTKKIKDGLDNFDKNILISTWQSVQRKDRKFFEQFGCIMFDEVHEEKSSNILKIMKNARCEYRFGCTGTMPEKDKEGLIDYYSIVGYFGPVIDKVSSSELIERGFASNLKINNIIMKYPEHFRKKNQKRSYDNEISAIEEYTPRDKVISLIIDESENKDNFLFLVKHITNNHLNRVYEYIQKNYPEYVVFKIDGTTKGKLREEIRAYANSNKKWCIVSTFACFSRGINIKSLANIAFMSPYKSKYKVAQGIGRGLRKHDSKEILMVYDVVDDFCDIQGTGRRVNKNHSWKHFEHRKKIYDKEKFGYVDIEFDLAELENDLF